MADLIVDSRETNSGIPALLRRAGVPFVQQELAAGDYQIGDVLLERKSANDLAASDRKLRAGWCSNSGPLGASSAPHRSSSASARALAQRPRTPSSVRSTWCRRPSARPNGHHRPEHLRPHGPASA
jgi:hypothetical protein